MTPRDYQRLLDQAASEADGLRAEVQRLQGELDAATARAVTSERLRREDAASHLDDQAMHIRRWQAAESSLERVEEATQRELELEYKQRQAADESVRLAGQELARARLERDSAKAQFDQHVEWASAEIARVEAARDDAEAKYLACYEELTRVEAARAALEELVQAILASVREDEKGEQWTIRAFLDKRGVYHENMSGSRRLVAEACKSVLSVKAEAR